MNVCICICTCEQVTSALLSSRRNVLRIWPEKMCHLVPEGVDLDGVLCCQADAAEQDEEEDEVGEDVVVDDLVAHNPEPEGSERDRGGRSEKIIFLKTIRCG